MSRPFRVIPSHRQRLRRLTAVALLALQGAVAVSPLLEPRSEGRLSAHAEQDGARHVNLHNESTCALCSARTQTSMPAPAPEPLASPKPRIVVARVSYAARFRDVAPTNLSRAPPPLPA